MNYHPWLIQDNPMVFFSTSVLTLLDVVDVAEANKENRSSFIWCQWATLARQHLVGYVIIILPALLRYITWIFIEVSRITHCLRKIFSKNIFDMCNRLTSLFNWCSHAWLSMTEVTSMTPPWKSKFELLYLWDNQDHSVFSLNCLSWVVNLRHSIKHWPKTSRIIFYK